MVLVANGIMLNMSFSHVILVHILLHLDLKISFLGGTNVNGI